MKTLDELRKGFEETRFFQENDHVVIIYNHDGLIYETNFIDFEINCAEINGAWWMYQELHSHDTV